MTSDKANSVLQQWMTELTWKKQSVLLGAIRAPDTLTTLKLKQVTVWLRVHVLENADPLTGFMHPRAGRVDFASEDSLPLFEHMDREYERLPLHAAHHITLAMEVIGLEHPDMDVRATAWKFWTDAVRALHLNPETRDQYESRYADSPDRMRVGTS